MQKFWYGTMKPTFPTRELCYTDTDSLVIDILTDDLYLDLGEMKEHFDFSNYPIDHALYDPHNNAVLGKFKDECAGKILAELVALRGNSYSMQIYDGKTMKQKNAAAGIKKAIQTSVNHETYKKTLFNENDTYITQNILRSYDHTVHSVTQTRVGLTAYDDKRYLLDNGIYTRAHGMF